jgi:hypothetical protein
VSNRLELPPLDLDLDLEALERAVAPTPRERLDRCWDAGRARLRRGWQDVLAVAGLLVVGGFVHARGMYRSPARIDDEGSYTAYAWSVEHLHQLAHYTYWYAHPPLGQLQMATWNILTDAFDRLPYAVATGREFAFVCKLVAIVLLYLLGRRLGFRRTTAAVAVAMFSLSPLAVYFQRTALLDNIVTPWLLAAFWFAASPRRSTWAAAGCASAFAVAVLTKETALLFMPALLLLFWQFSDRRNRRFTTTMLMAVMSLSGLTYPLYALLKHELLIGPGHVSLEWAIKWQLFGRTGSGSIFDPTSTAHSVVGTWLALDPGSCLAAVACAVPGLLARRTRAVALALTIQLASLLRNGYLPYPFVVAMIPFAALTVAGVVDALWDWSGLTLRPSGRRGLTGALRRLRVTPFRALVGLAVLAVSAGSLVSVVGPWRYGIEDLWHRDADAGKAAAMSWLLTSKSPRDVLVVDDADWVDLVRHGHPRSRVIWFTKLDVDRDVRLPARAPWRAIDYILLDHQDALSVHLNADWSASKETLSLFPTLGRAISHSKVVASFGAPADRVVVRRVVAPHPPVSGGPARLWVRR